MSASPYLSRGLLIAGAILLLAGLVVLAGQPAAIPVGDPGWFASASARHDRALIAMALGGAGAIASLGGLLHSGLVGGLIRARV